MFTALWLFNLAVLVGLTVMAWSPKYGPLRGSAVNPLIIFVIFSLFFNINFAVFYERGTVNIFERAVPVTSVDILSGYVHYTLIFLAVAVGLIGAQITTPPHDRSTDVIATDSRDRIITAAIFSVILLVGLVGALITLKALADILAGKLTRQLFFQSNPLLAVAYSLTCPGLAIYLSVRHPLKPATIAAVIGTLLILSVTGSRGIIILVGLIYAINLTVRGRSLPAYLYLFAIPILAYLLAFSRYLLRESWKFRSFADFVAFRGGFGELFFNSSEVAMAETITVIANDPATFSRPPFEGFLGLLMFPLPRSIFQFKPFSSPAHFTEALSPARWLTTQTEILTTGYGDLIMQFGIWGALPVAAVLAFIWLRGCLRVIHRPAMHTAIWLPLFIWWMYIFMRGAVFNVGASMWPGLLACGAYYTIRHISFQTHRVTRPIG